MSTSIATLAAQRNIAIRFHGEDSREAIEADQAWRRAKIAEAFERYGSALPDEVVAAILRELANSLT